MPKIMNDKPTTFLYRLADAIVRTFFRLSFRIRIEGVEHIPRDGGVIIASNHISNLDPPLIGICVPRYIRFMGKAELFSAPLLGKIFTQLGAFPIARGKIDKSAIRTAIQVVETGGCLVMFPEGHRSKNGELGRFLPGVSSIAKKSGGKIVPTAIHGPYRRFGRVFIRFGSPIEVNGSPGQISDELRERILQLLSGRGDVLE